MLPLLLAPLVAKLTSVGLDFAGQLIEKGGEKAVDFISEKTGIDLKTTPELSPEQITKIKEFQDSKEARELEAELTKLGLYATSEKNNLDDVKDARETYRTKNEQADKIAETVFKYNLPIIAGLIIADIVATNTIKEAVALSTVSTLIGMAIQRAWDERATIINFFFGSSIGSRRAQEKLLGDSK